MANQIASADNYVAALDQKYMQESVTSVLDTTQEVQYNEKTKKFEVATLEIDGLGDYDRAAIGGTDAYAGGSATLTWQDYAPDYERSKRIRVDVLDDKDAEYLVFANIAGELIQRHGAIELDAVRIAKYASKATKKNEIITNPADVLAALRSATTSMKQKSVSGGKVLFIDYDLYDNIADMDTYKSKAVLGEFSNIIPVASNILNTKVALANGKLGQFGWAPASDSDKINFLIVSEGAVMQFIRHAKPKTISSDVNQLADANEFLYRIQGVADVYKNKADGLYASIAKEDTENTEG